MGFSGSQYQALLNEKGETYLQQLKKYITDKQRRGEIQSEKKYLYGVLKRTPTIESLLTAADISIIEQNKRKQLVKQYKEDEQKQLQEERVTARCMSRLVADFLQKKTDSEISALKAEFNCSIFARGLKGGSDEVDFSKSVVQATYTRYIFTKYLLSCTVQ